MWQYGRVRISQHQYPSQKNQLASIHTQDAFVKLSETRNDVEATPWTTKTEVRKTSLEGKEKQFHLEHISTLPGWHSAALTVFPYSDPKVDFPFP